MPGPGPSSSRAMLRRCQGVVAARRCGWVRLVEQAVGADRRVVGVTHRQGRLRRRCNACLGRRARPRCLPGGSSRTALARPVRSRSSKAATMPRAPFIPANRSPIGTPTFVRGTRFPVRLIRPAWPCAIWSYPVGGSVPETRQRAEHQVRVELLEPLQGEPRDVQAPGPRAGRQPCDQRLQQGPAVVGLEVRCDGPHDRKYVEVECIGEPQEPTFVPVQTLDLDHAAPDHDVIEASGSASARRSRRPRSRRGAPGSPIAGTSGRTWTSK